MLKRLFVLLLLVPLLLAACNGTTVREDAPVVESTPTAEPATQEPAAQEPAAELATATVSSPKSGGLEMECTYVGDSPNVPPEYEAIFGVKGNDWVQGSETAAVTIVEYSDFQ